MNIKLKLILMHFLEYAIWGAWLISLGSYLGGTLHFDGLQIGSFFATMGLASLFMPGIMGVVADRVIPAQIVLGVCHLLSATFMFVASTQQEYIPLYASILLSVCFYMPTISLSNAVSYNAMTKARLDPVVSFPPIRVWGTVGFIVSMITVDLMQVTQNSGQLIFSGFLSILLGLYSFTLPSCAINKNKSEKKSWVTYFGLEAFRLFKQRKIAIFLVFSMFLGMLLQITNAFANGYLTDYFGGQSIYKGTFGVEHANILISLSQLSETLCILMIPFFMKRYGIKIVMLISMLAWVFRFLFLGLGNPGDGLWLFILSMIVYGVAFDFYNISGSLFIEKETDSSIRSSAQGLFMIMTNGFGAFIGSYAAGYIVKVYDWPTSWYIFSGFALVVTILFAMVFRYKHVQE